MLYTCYVRINKARFSAWKLEIEADSANDAFINVYDRLNGKSCFIKENSLVTVVVTQNGQYDCNFFEFTYTSGE